MCVERVGRLRQRFRQLKLFGITPKAFEIVVTSHFFEKDVKHHFAVIEKNPTIGRISFKMVRMDTLEVERLYNLVGNGLGLACGLCGADEEVVGDIG